MLEFCLYSQELKLCSKIFVLGNNQQLLKLHTTKVIGSPLHLVILAHKMCCILNTHNKKPPCPNPTYNTE